MRPYYTKHGMKTPLLTIKDLNVSYHHHHALKNITLSMPLKGITGIVGPNGAGKSTLLKSMCQLLKISSGTMTLDEHELSSFHSQIAYVPQKRDINLDFPIIVEEVVAQGALAKKKWYQGLNKKDFQKASEILAKLELSHLAKRPLSHLSGGQQQRVFLARALMQEAKILCLDEPFVGLDVVSEETLIKELKTLSEQGLYVFIVHHDLNSWKKYFDQLILLKSELIAAGSFQEVFTHENLFKAFGINFKDCS